MCLTIPGKIKAIKEGIATVESGRETASIDLSLVLDARPGDWVLHATNRAVKLITEEDAKEILALLNDNYSPVDVSKLPLKFKKIIFKVRSNYSSSPAEGRVEKSVDNSSRHPSRQGGAEAEARTIKKPTLSKEEVIYLLNLRGKNNLETLHAEANFLRKDKIKDFICIHGIIEFSNYCRRDCLYCGIRKSNEVPRYRMSRDEIVKVAEKAVKKDGYKLIVLQSGEDISYSDEDLIEIVREIKQKMRVFIFLSVGVRSKEFYKKAFEAGATGSLLRFETADPRLFKEIKPDQDFEKRFSSIKDQMAMGYYMATGSLFGLPGQTIDQIADDLLMLQKLNPPMASSGPWLPAKGTPLARSKEQVASVSAGTSPDGSSKEQLELTLKYIAIARFLMPEAKIPVTTALETLDPEGRHKGLLAGANSLMFNLTPDKYCKNYKIYDNKFKDREKIWQKYGLFKDEESWTMLEEKMARNHTDLDTD